MLFIGKSTIKGPFSIAMLNYQRVMRWLFDKSPFLVMVWGFIGWILYGDDTGIFREFFRGEL